MVGTENNQPKEADNFHHYSHVPEILVAEDNPANQKLIEIILKKIGCNSVIVENGEEAITQLKEKNFDIIFMDLQMPMLNGFEATNRIRKQNQQIPIIALTANAIREDINRCFQIGMNDYIMKPYQKNEIFQIIEKWVFQRTHNKTANKRTVIDKNPDKPRTSEFSYQDLLDKFFGEKEIVEKVIDDFLEKGDKQIRTLNKMIEQKDFYQIQFITHSLKGSAWNLTMKELGDAAFVLEEAGKQREEKHLEKYYKILTKKFKRIQHIIKHKRSYYV